MSSSYSILFTFHMYTNTDLKALTFSSSIYILIRVPKFSQKIILIIVWFTLVMENFSVLLCF